MSGNWIKMRTRLDETIPVGRMSRALGKPEEVVVLNLYRLAGWFQQHGKYGKMACAPDVVDMYLEWPGFAEALASVGWLRNQGGVLTLFGFCDVSATRKSLGKVIRQKILANACCAACGDTEELEIDHKIPVVRGGSCDESNLQALCSTCNRTKGRRTMDEFMAERRTA